ncbi:CPBP family intramembrane glutamic endopeptidase [Nonomuraea sp. NPDC049400]|uniref:CPBP family intramembrane glutamic endopeptidase n=1 Tax=Nonomuraea sp. NPDC049400 TaxID=3364352 RepID=UPI0037AC5713
MIVNSPPKAQNLGAETYDEPPHALWMFFALAFAFSWLFYLPIVLSDDGLGLLPIGPDSWVLDVCVIAGSFGPLAAALVTLRVTSGRGAGWNMLRGLRFWRVPLRWYLVVIGGVIAVPVAAAFAVPGTADHFTFSADLVPSLIIMFLTVQLVIGALGEEPGWRGYALPRLQHRYGAFPAAVILGLMWGGWHLPLFVSSAWAGPKGGGDLGTIAQFLLLTTVLTIFMTWVFNSTGGSLLIMVLLHDAFNTGMNAVSELFNGSAMAREQSLLPSMIGFGILAVLITLATRARLSRQRPA